MMELPKRKNIRLPNYDYNQDGAYFITICTKERKKILSNVGATIGRPNAFLNEIQLTGYGKIVKTVIKNIPIHYPSLTVDKYVIMPDHVHLLLRIHSDIDGRPMVAPTIEMVIRQTKGIISKEIGQSIFQRSYYDHIIRNQQDYNEIWEYIENNPKKWILKHINE